MSESVRISHVSQFYGAKQVLKDVDFEVKQGEILGLLGPSGSGKTTLVNCMMGMVRMKEGDIHLLGTKIPNTPLLKRIGFMAQSDALYGDLTGLDNLIFFARLNGMGKKEATKQAVEIMKLVNLHGDMDKKVLKYSGGMKRRLSLAIALMNNPDLLILDEPTVGIDPVLRQVFWEEFKRKKEQGVTIIVTTHVMDEAEKCDKLGLISEGKLIAFGTPNEILKQTQTDTLEKAFIALSQQHLSKEGENHE